MILALGTLSLGRLLYQALSVLLQTFVLPGKNVGEMCSINGQSTD